MNYEIVAFIVYFLVVLAIGIIFFIKGKGTGEKEYFLGGRSMGPWVTALSAQASDMSAWLLMGLPGSILAFGFGQMWIGIGLGLGTIANWIFVAKRLRKFSRASNDAITLPQYLSNRFASSVSICVHSSERGSVHIKRNHCNDRHCQQREQHQESLEKVSPANGLEAAKECIYQYYQCEYSHSSTIRQSREHGSEHRCTGNEA